LIIPTIAENAFGANALSWPHFPFAFNPYTKSRAGTRGSVPRHRFFSDELRLRQDFHLSAPALSEDHLPQASNAAEFPGSFRFNLQPALDQAAILRCIQCGDQRGAPRKINVVISPSPERQPLVSLWQSRWLGAKTVDGRVFDARALGIQIA
jgi:hypothetical protein